MKRYSQSELSKAAEAAAKARRLTAEARQTAIRFLRYRIQTDGARPPAWCTPAGARLLDAACSGSDWFIVGNDWIWYIQSNGEDGDDWNLNNVRTGGAGAIGWRVPYDPVLARSLHALAAVNASQETPV